MRHYFWSLLNAVLLAVVIGQVWSIQTCPSMTDPSHCHRYVAGCGALCTASVPWTGQYLCCCSVRDPVTGSVIGCCEARCVQWICVYPWGANCGWDVDFGALDIHGNPQVRYINQLPCVHNPNGLPMQGYCASGGPPGGPGGPGGS